jgi:hypothetical protein
VNKTMPVRGPEPERTTGQKLEDFATVILASAALVAVLLVMGVGAYLYMNPAEDRSMFGHALTLSPTTGLPSN